MWVDLSGKYNRFKAETPDGVFFYRGYSAAASPCSGVSGYDRIFKKKRRKRSPLNTRPFFIVDVFAERKYTGNPLAVICNADGLDTQTMQCIAQEMNYSETTFITGIDADGRYKVRIFTPTEELPFAGHPTLGTAFIIRETLLKQNVSEVELSLKVGPIAVTFGKGENMPLWMRQNAPKFGKTFDVNKMAYALGIDPASVDGYPVQEVSTGLPFIIVPLKTLQAVKTCKVQAEQVIKLTKDTEAKAVMVFCPETIHTENHLHARVFVDCYGIPEDPATGSANGCLAAYLSKYRYFGEDQIDLRVEQGYEIGRPSLLLLRAESVYGSIQVDVGGKVVMVARGELL